MSDQRDNSGGVPAWLVAPLAGVLGFALAPPLVKATVVAVVFGVLVVFALAHGHGITLRAATALYAGRAVLAAAKALAIVAVEWPLRAAHRIWVRYDAPLRAQLAATRAATRAAAATRSAGAAALARAHQRHQRPTELEPARAEVLALPPAPPAGVGAEQVIAHVLAPESTTAA